MARDFTKIISRVWKQVWNKRRKRLQRFLRSVAFVHSQTFECWFQDWTEHKYWQMLCIFASSAAKHKKHFYQWDQGCAHSQDIEEVDVCSCAQRQDRQEEQVGFLVRGVINRWFKLKKVSFPLQNWLWKDVFERHDLNISSFGHLGSKAKFHKLIQVDYKALWYLH